MTICEFCVHHSDEVECAVGINVPKTMKCRQFCPGIEKFCAEPDDFVSPNQIVEMARFFGLDKTELKKVTVIANQRLMENCLRS